MLNVSNVQSNKHKKIQQLFKSFTFPFQCGTVAPPGLTTCFKPAHVLHLHLLSIPDVACQMNNTGPVVISMNCFSTYLIISQMSEQNGMEESPHKTSSLNPAELSLCILCLTYRSVGHVKNFLSVDTQNLGIQNIKIRLLRGFEKKHARTGVRTPLWCSQNWFLRPFLTPVM